jgi:hypothetical protein
VLPIKPRIRAKRRGVRPLRVVHCRAVAAIRIDVEGKREIFLRRYVPRAIVLAVVPGAAVPGSGVTTGFFAHLEEMITPLPGIGAGAVV